MKDQLALLRKCVVNQIPATVFQGDDTCTRQPLKSTEGMALLASFCMTSRM